MANPTISLNQFELGHMIGEIDLSFSASESVFSVLFDPTAGAATLEFGEGVKLIDLGASDQAGPPIVGLRTTDLIPTFGVRVHSTKQASVPAGYLTEIATKGAVVYMASAGALARGVKVSLDQANSGFIQAMGTKSEFGITLDKIAANGLGRVWITADGFTSGT